MKEVYVGEMRQNTGGVKSNYFYGLFETPQAALKKVEEDFPNSRIRGSVVEKHDQHFLYWEAFCEVEKCEIEFTLDIRPRPIQS
jgi:hypothetical protein